MRSLKGSISSSDWRKVEKTINLFSLLKVKLLYKTVSNKVVNRHGYFAKFNKLIISLVGCNTAAMPHEDLFQSKCCLFFLSPCVSKNKVDIQHALQTLDQARKYIEKNPSRAEDSGSILRTTQHWLTRFLNSLDNTMKVADTQAVGTLFKLNAEIFSECFFIFCNS